MNNQTIGKLRIETLLQELQPFFFIKCAKEGHPSGLLSILHQVPTDDHLKV